MTINIKYLFLTFILFYSCNIDLVDKTKVPQVSIDISESKKNNVFIKEYQSSNPDLFNEVWTEELWILDSLNEIVKLDEYRIYFKSDLNIGISKDSINYSWCSNCGNYGKYVFSRLSEEEKLKDTLHYYFFDLENNKCLGKIYLEAIN